MSTLLVALSHPDDEVGCAGTVAAHVASGDRVVLLWLTRGESSTAFGELGGDAVAERRMEQGREVAGILGAEARFMDFPDTRVHATPDAAARVARVLAGIAPDAVLTWGEAWGRGMRHPDHQATGKIVRDAVTLARVARVVERPHRSPAPIFTLRDRHSTLPELAVDVTAHTGVVEEVAAYYRAQVGWPDADWLSRRLRDAGARWGVEAAELLDVWDTDGGLVRLLPAGQERDTGQ